MATGERDGTADLRRTFRRYRRGAFAAVGLAVAAVALLAVVAPATVRGLPVVGSLATALASWTVRDLMLAGAAVVGLSVLWAAWNPGYERAVSADRAATERFERLLANPPEAVTADQRSLTGEAFDATAAAAIAGDEDAMATVRTDLRRVATDAVAAAAGCGPDEARARVERGEWTDDAVAAAFLATAEGPAHSLAGRVRLWLDPEAERDRRISRTVAALRARGEGEP